MRLIRLSANKSSFKTINFRREGLTLIIGRKATPESVDEGKTYNGVGKSLVVRIIHFCLGSSTIKEFKDKLPDWEFSLEFEVNDERFLVTRSTTSQNVVNLNGVETKIKAFTDKFGSKVFDLGEFPFLTFRSLICRFIRPSKASYNIAEMFVRKETPYAQLLNNAYLLGFDPKIIQRKRELIVDREKTKGLKGNFDKDEILHSFYRGKKDPQLEIQELDEQIGKLSHDIQHFDVAENYHEIRRSADESARKIREIENRSVVLHNAIENIKTSITSRPDVPRDKVLNLYSEVQLTLGNEVRRTLDEVLDFHAKLFANRKARLLGQLKQFENEFDEKTEQRKMIGIELDRSLRFLKTHKALDEVLALSAKLNELEMRSQKLKDYQELIRQYDAKLQQLNISISQENLNAQAYLDSQEEVMRTKLVGLFRSFAKEFYNDKPSGIVISNNDGDNQIRFDIVSKIQDDASDGINEVKIFCFDMTLLKTSPRSQVKFIFHDSRLFSDMDPRQRETLFRLAYENTLDNGFQYIASVNEDQIFSLREKWDDEKYKAIIEDNIVLELTDASAEGKLLGIEVDMDYDS